MNKPPSPFAAPEPWNLVADGYADELEWVMRPFSRRAAELAALGPNASIIDVAAGPGTLALMVASRVAKVTAIDFSEQMLSRLRADARAQGIDNVETHQGDGQALPFPDSQFDAGFSMFGLMFFPDRRKGFAELFRVLRPGAVAVVSSWAPTDEAPLMDVMFGALRAADPTRPAPQRDPTTLENPELFVEEFSGAGFVDVRIEPHVHSFPRTEPGQFWEGLTRASAPCVLLRQKLGEAEWALQSEKAKAYIAERFSDPKLELSTKAFLGIGRKPS